MCSPNSSRSSPTLPTMVTSSGSTTSRRPWRKRAAPTPPARTVMGRTSMRTYHAREAAEHVHSVRHRLSDDAVRHAPLGGVALVAAGAALWGIDGVLRQPLVDFESPGAWSPYTIVLYEHIILTLLVAPFLVRHIGGLRRLDAAGWASALVIAWGGSALATLAFTKAFAYGNPSVVVLQQKT